MNVQKLREYALAHWQPIAVYGALFAALAAGLYWRLATLVPGYAAGEAATYQASIHWQSLQTHPLNAPFLLAEKALSYITPHSLLAGRLVATGCGLAVLAVFALLLNSWHSMRTAVLGTLLFGLSASFLHTARLGTPEVTLFALFALVACGFWLKQTGAWYALTACFALAALLLYVPGMAWLIGAAAVWQWRTIDRIFKRHVQAVTLSGLFLVLLLAPIGWALYKNPALIRPLLALPQHWPGVTAILHNLADVPFRLFVHNASDPATWLGTAPLLDAFSLTMFALGCYVYGRHWRLARTALFILLFAVVVVLCALDGDITLAAITPFIYLVIAAGIANVTEQWFRVFPRNPIARSFGWGGIGLLVGLACAYHITHYFVGWPEASATRAVFTVQKPS